MRPLKINLPKAAIAEFCQLGKIIELAVFGSVLRDDFNTDSDIDFLFTFSIVKAARLIVQFQEGTEKQAFLTNKEKQSAIIYQIMIIGEAVKRLSLVSDRGNAR